MDNPQGETNFEDGWALPFELGGVAAGSKSAGADGGDAQETPDEEVADDDDDDDDTRLVAPPPDARVVAALAVRIALPSVYVPRHPSADDGGDSTHAFDSGASRGCARVPRMPRLR